MILEDRSKTLMKMNVSTLNNPTNSVIQILHVWSIYLHPGHWPKQLAAKQKQKLFTYKTG